MNPLSALGQIAHTVGNGIGNVGGAIEGQLETDLSGIGRYAWHPQATAQATQGAPDAPFSLNMQSPVPTTKLTNQINPQFQAPVPQAQIALRPMQPSGFQNTMTDIGNIGHNVASFFGGGQPQQPLQQAVQRAQVQIPPTNPTSTQHPLVQHALQRFGGQQQQAPTPQPGVSQVEQFPTSIPGVDPQVSQNFINTLQQILPVTRKYGIPDAVVAAQAAQESGYMQKPAAQNNFFGLRGHTMPWAAFKTPQEGAEYYAQTVQSKVPNMQGMTPLQVLTALQSGKQRYEGDNPDPMQYVYDTSHNPAWKTFGGGDPYPTNPNGWAK